MKQIVHFKILKIFVPSRIIVGRRSISIGWIIVEIGCVYGTFDRWQDWRCQ